MKTPRPAGTRGNRVPALAGAAAIALLLPTLSVSTASAAPAADALATTISSAGAFTQIVPDGVCSVNVIVAGAPGGMAMSVGDVEPDPDDPGSLRGPNGAGGVVAATLAVGAGSVLTGQVGSSGGNGGGGGLPGGGEGGAGAHRGGGGGGYSQISFDGDLLLLAAGGGGTGGGHTADFGHGGDGGFDLASGVAASEGLVFPGGDGTAGQDQGVNAVAPALTTAPGAGLGGSIVGGVGGTNPRSQTDPALPGFDWNATSGSALQGGTGGADTFADTGAGGGAGYFGGGGGAGTDGDVGAAPAYFVGGGAGGGSSFASDSALIGAGSLELSKNRDDSGDTLAGFVTFEWVMCAYDLAVTKTVVGNPVFEDGATVRYSVVVTNNGSEDMAIGDTVSFEDELAVGGTLVSVSGLSDSAPAAGDTIPAGGVEAYDLVDVVGPDPKAPPAVRERGLPAGASVEFVYDVVVAGTEPVTNVVTVTDRGDQSNNSAEATIDPAAPALSLTKTADAERATTVGQSITYSFLVTNTGNIALEDIAVKEGQFSGKGSLPNPICPAGSVEPGASVTCTSVYTVVAADLTGAALTNTATAVGATPMGSPVESGQAAASILTVKPVAQGALANTGGGDGAGFAAAGALLLLAGLVLVAVRRATVKA